MRKVTLAIAMLPLLASAPVLAASVSSQTVIQLAQVGTPGGDQFSQQICNLAQQSAQSYARILQLRDKMLKIQRDNETRFQALEKGKGGARNHVSIGSTAILDEAMRDSGGTGQGGGYHSPGMQQELMRNLTGKIEDVDVQISFTDNQLQKAQEDNEFRFEELEKKNGLTSPASSATSQPAPAAASPGTDLCAQGGGNAAAIADALSARAEAMNFQILEMQDQMQKMQEENESRFQFLETGKRADVEVQQAGGDTSLADASNGNPGGGVSGNSQGGGYETAAQSAANQSTGADSMAIGSNAPASGGPARGEPPQTLGSIRFDANGNVIGETLNAAPRTAQPGVAPGAAPGETATGSAVASLPTDDNPNSLYEASYQYLMSGDYKAAETGFREHVKRYPADPNTAEARFWLGESLYGQGRYPEAATVFIDTQRDYPDSKRAPENMFKLGMTLEKMDNRDVACATFAQIPERYPKAAPAILKRVADERSRAKC